MNRINLIEGQMGISELRSKIDLAPGVVAPNQAELLAAGPITKQPHTNAFRTILVSWHGEFVVWTQYWDSDDERHWDEGALSVKGAGYADQGDYFRPNEFDKATARFAERVARDARTITTIYREAVPA